MPFDTTQPAYLDFRETLKQRTNQVVIWCGAGLSMPAGLPNWPELIEKLVKDCRKKLQASDVEGIKRIKALVDLADGEANAWEAFAYLKKALGDSSYAAAIRSAFQGITTAPIPINYSRLWALGITGFLNLNIDRFASRGFSMARSGDALREFEGINIDQHVDVLRSATPFVANLHGTLENEQSWIFTTEELEQLFERPGYNTLLQTCFTARTILFLGISADDPAATGHLQKFRKFGLNPGAHYWLTTRADSSTDKWAEAVGLRRVIYRSDGNQHVEVDEFLEDLERYVPRETVATPVTPSTRRERNLVTPSPEDVEIMKANDIRLILNKEASRILGSSSPARFGEYLDFWERYGEAIYRAWSVTTNPPNNNLFEYTLQKTLAKGAFGCVYEAKNEKGDDVAIKILHGNVKEEPEMIDSFRRGVSAMRILSDRKVHGMVPYVAAWEIPTCTVMELVVGPNLEEAVDAGFVDSWDMIIGIAIDIARIIRSAHQLPERVLHRDIRPPNVMLKNYYTDSTDFEVVVLDFDLSWHRDASGLSVDFRTSTNGYLAPEQLDPGRKNLTRNALVDSFGLGMTLYFVVCGRHPLVSQHLYRDWRAILQEKIVGRKCNAWRSLPRRVARLIEWATKDEQSKRWDMTRIQGELINLLECLKPEPRGQPLELLAEEIAARCESMSREYSWNSERLCAQMELKSGFNISVFANMAQLEVVGLIEWFHMGDRPYKDVRRYIAGAVDRVCAALKSGGWRIIQRQAAFDRCRIEVATVVGQLKSSKAIQKVASSLSEAVAILRFE